MARLVFEKKGRAVWISHLDLMRLFQRAFQRAGLTLKHTQGFNPRPSVSIALPMSVGVESGCELLDFELETEMPPLAEMRRKLNDALVEGVKVLQIYEGGRKLRDLALLDCTVTLEYDNGIDSTQCNALTNLFQQDTLLVTKKSKNGPVEQDLIPMIRKIDVKMEDANTVKIESVVCCQNPTLNPAQFLAAITKYLPDLTPDFSKCTRIEIYNSNHKIFR